MNSQLQTLIETYTSSDVANNLEQKYDAHAINDPYYHTHFTEDIENMSSLRKRHIGSKLLSYISKHTDNPQYIGDMNDVYQYQLAKENDPIITLMIGVDVDERFIPTDPNKPIEKTTQLIMDVSLLGEITHTSPEWFNGSTTTKDIKINHLDEDPTDYTYLTHIHIFGDEIMTMHCPNNVTEENTVAALNTGIIHTIDGIVKGRPLYGQNHTNLKKTFLEEHVDHIEAQNEE